MGAGGGASGLTVTFTLADAELAFASLTTSEKVRMAAGWLNFTIGAVKVGVTDAPLESVTIAPAVCVQLNVRGRAAGSALALPSRVTKAPEATAWAGPAFAVGAAGGGGGGGGGATAARWTFTSAAATLPSTCWEPLTSTVSPAWSPATDVTLGLPPLNFVVALV